MDTASAAYDPDMPVCQRCGEDNPARARFCRPTPLLLAASERGRRESASGSACCSATWSGSPAGPSSWTSRTCGGLLGPYYGRLRSDLERHGGTVEKFIGDAVMALFGAPVAHEDD